MPRAPARFDRDGLRSRPGPMPLDHGLGERHVRARLAVQPVRDRSSRAPAQPVPLQQPAGCLPPLRGIRAGHRAGSRPHRPGPVEVDPRRGDRALDHSGPPGIAPGPASAQSTSLGIPVDVPFNQLSPEQVKIADRRPAGRGLSRPERLLRRGSNARPGEFRFRSSSAAGGVTSPAPTATGAGFAPRRWPCASSGSTSPSSRP